MSFRKTLSLQATDLFLRKQILCMQLALFDNQHIKKFKLAVKRFVNITIQ
jgi:hypothetical protein